MKWINLNKFFIFLFLQITKQEEIKIIDEIQTGTVIVDQVSKSVFINERPDGKPEYKLLSGGPFIDYLHIDSSNGKLFAKKTIDRDSLCVEIDLCCKNDRLCSIPISIAMVLPKATDPIIRQIFINIEDKNDHKPTFENLIFNLSISESCPLATVFQLPMAIDKDSDIYSVKTYKLLSKTDESTFSLETQLVDNKITAYLRLKQRLDREENDLYKLTVIAIDGGQSSLTGTLLVMITILDINDNSPTFENIRYLITINESKMSNDPIIQLRATDKDIGENAEIFYKMDLAMSSMGGSNIFRVDPHSGAIYLISPLDYEKQQNYKLIITASNKIPGVSTATATLTVNVLNVNDEKPIIFVDYFNNRQHALITEHTPAPKFVSVVSVTDKDIGIAGKVTCHLENDHELFDLRQSGKDQYKIHTRQPLDREINPKYSLSVICQDQGNPSLTAAVIIPVIIIDENDNKPEIISQSIFHILENKPAGTFLTKIDATDKDEGVNRQLVYTITDTGNRINSYLTIDSQSGIITTIQAIDREATNPPLTKLDFMVTVSDCGSPKQSSVKALQLIIDDENDNPPQFAQTTLRYSIAENENPMYRLGQIEVSDPDEIGIIHLSISYNKLNYRKCPFTLTKEKKKFWLTSTESLDWETQSSHELIVITTDGIGYKSHTVTATIHVTVQDVNDNSPIFIFPRPGNRTTHTLSCRQQPGFVLLTVSASDRDNPDIGNGKFFFTIISDLSNLFNIDPNLGKIRVNRQMSSSDIGDHYLNIRVEDHGTPPLSSDLRIKVLVKDIPIYFTEKGNDYDGFRLDNSHSLGSILSDRESIFVIGLVLILLFVLICLCFIMYVRHVKGWFIFLPDFISLCRYKEETSSMKAENFTSDEIGNQIASNKYCSTNYYSQHFMANQQANFSRTPEIFMKNGRDCYEILKCPQEVQNDSSQTSAIHEQSYNDVISTKMLLPFQDNYHTLQPYPNDYPTLKDNGNFQNFSKPSKSISIQSTGNTIPLNMSDKSNPTSFISSKLSYAVSFPTEQSTFV